MLRCIRDVRAISTRHAILSKSRGARSTGVKSANRQIIRMLQVMSEGEPQVTARELMW